jgi:hypothetical protein
MLQINNDKDAIKLSAEFADNIDVNIWMEYLNQHPELHGFYCKLNNKYNIEKYSRREPTNYSTNTKRYEERNINLFKNMVIKHLNINNPSILDVVTPNELENYYMWYPILSVSSGCIWNDKAINFDKCKLVLEIPAKLLQKCKRSDNSIKTLLRYINKNNMINSEIAPDINNNMQSLPRLFNNSDSRTRKSGSSGRRRSKKANSQTELNGHPQ